MPTTSPRVNVVFQKPVYALLRESAHKGGVSLSAKVRDLVLQAMEIEEDLALSTFAEGRERTFDRATALTHEQVQGRTRRKRR